MLLVGGATPRTFAPSGKNPCTATGYECNYRDPSTGILVKNNTFSHPVYLTPHWRGSPQNLEISDNFKI